MFPRDFHILKHLKTCQYPVFICALVPPKENSPHSRILTPAMAPKKKGNKKGNDDWEAELGEQPDLIAAATQEAKDAEAVQNDEQAEAGGGGLLAALKKNKSNKKKKGKTVQEDYVDGEDPPAIDGLNGHVEPNGILDLAAKAPEEATTDDLFSAQVGKTKGGSGKQGQKDEAQKEDAEDSAGEGGGIKSKKEKEREKKEREKQRKKEQVRLYARLYRC